MQTLGKLLTWAFIILVIGMFIIVSVSTIVSLLYSFNATINSKEEEFFSITTIGAGLAIALSAVAFTWAPSISGTHTMSELREKVERAGRDGIWTAICFIIASLIKYSMGHCQFLSFFHLYNAYILISKISYCIIIFYGFFFATSLLRKFLFVLMEYQDMEQT